MACRLWVIYVREDNDSNVLAMITRLMWTIWTSLSAVPKKSVKFNHSLTHLGGKSCALAPLSIIPKFLKEKHLSDLSSKSSIFMYFIYVWLWRDTKCFFFLNFVNKKWHMRWIAPKKANSGREFCLEIVSTSVVICQAVYPAVGVPGGPS